MKHLVLIVAALLAAGFGIALLVITKASTMGLILSSGFVLMALWFMAKVELKEFGDACSGWWHAYKNPPSTKDGAP